MTTGFHFQRINWQRQLLLKFSDVYYFEAFQHSKLADVGSLHFTQFSPNYLEVGLFKLQKGEKIDFQNGVKIEMILTPLWIKTIRLIQEPCEFFSKWYDPADPNTSRTVPTNLQAINRDGSDGLLSPYAFLSIEFHNISKSKTEFWPKLSCLKYPHRYLLNHRQRYCKIILYRRKYIRVEEESTATKWQMPNISLKVYIHLLRLPKMENIKALRAIF